MFVPVGADGKVRIFNNQGSTDVVVDVVGYMLQRPGPSDRTAGSCRCRRRIARSTPAMPQFGGVALGPGQAEDWSFAAFASSVAIGADSVGNQLAVIGNLTSASLTRQYPSVPVELVPHRLPGRRRRPLSSNLNTIEGPAASPTWRAQVRRQTTRCGCTTSPGYAHYLFDASAVVLAN